MGCGSPTAVRIFTILSVLLAAGLGIYTAILFKEVYDEKNSDAAKVADAAGGLFNKVSDTFGLQEKVNPLKNLNIRFYCYGTVIGAAALQLLTSLLLLGCSGAKGGPSTAKLYIFINTWVMVAIVAAAVCFFVSKAVDYENDQNIQCFLAACGIDFIFLFLVLCVAGAFARS